MQVKNLNYSSLYAFLFEKYQRLNKKRFLILIGGCSRSGKTTLANKIRKDLLNRKINCLIVSLDNWLLGINERTGNETVRERFKYKEIVSAFSQLMIGGKVFPPTYNSKSRLITSRKSDKFLFINDGVLIADGVVALDITGLRKISDLKIFVDVDDFVRKDRLKHFYIDYKKCSPEESKNIVDKRELEEVPTIKSTQKYANIIYDGKI